MNKLKEFGNMYVDGFRNMSKLGVKLWIIIFVKLVIMFAILKVFFFENYLNTRYDTDEEKSNHVIEELINKKQN